MMDVFVVLAEAAGSGAEPAAASGLAPAAYGLEVLGVVLGAIGLWLMVPPGSGRRRAAGGLVAAVGLGLLASGLPWLGSWADQAVFWLIAGVAVASAAATIAMRSPVYSALWFALALLATAGLFLLQQAQFLGVATVIVYAGAILVTFLFVLMLAQPEGHAYYDRISWGPLAPLLATVCGGLIVAGLMFSLSRFTAERAQMPAASAAPGGGPIAGRGPAPMSEHHVARLGGQLFSSQLLSVEAAGTLLLVALVGAIAIVIQTQQVRRAMPTGARGARERAGGAGHG